jgi:hypothetical protein
VTPQVVAHRGDEQYLIDVGDGLGRVFDTEQDVVFAPFNIDSIVARGYWEPVSDVPEAVQARLDEEFGTTVTAAATLDLVEFAAPDDAHLEKGNTFTVTLIDEAKPTVDGRVFEPGQVTWREPPLPLMFMVENGDNGHKGSRVGGAITRVWRDGELIKGEGHFASSDDGQQLKQLIHEQVLTGISSDVGGAVVEQELAEDGTPQNRIMRGRIMGATVLPFQAFDDTRIAVVASAVPERAPAAWFDDPRLDGPTALTITKDGQVFGHAALWHTCHIGRPGECLTPPHSSSGYQFFTTGAVETAEGKQIHVGQITLGTGHAGVALGAKPAVNHYDHTGFAVADVATGEDSYGIWVAGAVRPGVDDSKLHELRASAISGDWRTINGGLELVALLAVNVPGFPVPRARASFATDGNAQLALVAAGVVTDEEVAALAAEDSEDLNVKTIKDAAADEAVNDRPGDVDADGEELAPLMTSELNVPPDASEDEPEDDGGDAPDTDDDDDDEELTDEQREALTARVVELEAAVLALAAGQFEELKDFSDKTRSQLADEGEAMPDGSFPIENTGDLRRAIQAFGRAKNKDAVKAFIKKRARELDAVDSLPEDWQDGGDDDSED